MFNMNYVFELISANNHQIVMKPKYDVNGLFKRLWFTSDDFLENNRLPDEKVKGRLPSQILVF